MKNAIFLVLAIPLLSACHKEPAAQVIGKENSQVASDISQDKNHRPTELPSTGENVSGNSGKNILLDAVKLAETDPAKAFEYIDSSCFGLTAEQTKAELLVRLGREDLATVVQSLGFMTNPAERAFALTRLGGFWAERDLGKALSFADGTLKGADKNGLMLGILDQQVRTMKFDSAVTTIGKMPLSEARTECVFNLAMSWAQKDFSSAAKWMAGLAPEDRKSAISAVMPVLEKQKNVESILQVVESSDDRLTRRDGVDRVVRILTAGGDLSAARQWLIQLPDELRGNALASYIKNSSAKNVDEFANMVFALKDREGQVAATAAIVNKMFARNPVDAALWVTKAPQAVADPALQVLAGTWYNTDATEFSTWVYSLPKGSLKDSALMHLAHSVARSDRASALAIGSQIGDPKQRAIAMQSLRR